MSYSPFKFLGTPTVLIFVHILNTMYTAPKYAEWMVIVLLLHTHVFTIFRAPFGRQDIHLYNIQVSNGGMDLISEDSLTLSYGKRYGLVGRNGTGKSTFLRHLALKTIPGAEPNCQVTIHSTCILYYICLRWWK